MASANPTTARPATGDRKLQLKEILEWMVEDGHIDSEGAAKLHSDARMRPGRHPIVTISEAKLRSKKLPSLLLSADIVTEWVALKVKMTDLLISLIRPACDAGQSPESVIQKVREAIDSQ